MTLNLAVPAQESNANLTVETRPRQVGEWLESLPLTNPVETSRAICDGLTALNRTKVSDETRLKLLETYRGTISKLLPALEDQFTGMPLPLPDKSRQIANQTRQLYAELANGYKLILVDHANRRISFGSGKLLPLIVQRAISSLSRILVVCYQTYAPTPAGIWAEIHQLFLYAATEKIQDEPVADLETYSSVGLAYKQALLLALVDPYKLMQGEVGKVMDYLTHFGSHAQLQPLAQTNNPTALFLVRLESDRPARAVAHNTSVTDARTDILLNTIELARLLHHQILRLEAGDNPQTLLLPGASEDPAYRSLLRRALKHWGVAPKRLFKRIAKDSGMGVQKNADITVCAGIRSTHYLLSGGEVLNLPEQAEEGIETEITLQPTGSLLEKETAPNCTGSHWLTVNESAGGLAMRRASRTGAKIRVGEIIGLRPENTAAWNIGVVRWMHSESPDHLEMGAQMLAPSARAILIKPVIGPSTDTFQPALLLPEVQALRQPATIAAARGAFQPKREFFVEENGATCTIRAVKLVEQTASFDLFEFSFS